MRQYGLIGYPLAHSFSEQYFTGKFLREHLTDCIFKAFPIPAISGLPALLHDNPLLKGLSVTIPYKEQVLAYVTGLSDEVSSIRASNSIKISGGELIAFNTDIKGFERSLAESLQPYHKKALVLGTGGASKAVQFVLKKLGIAFLVVSRNPNVKDCITYGVIDGDIMSEHQIIINCTPAGMWPNENDCPELPYQLITPRHYVFDLIYKPAETMLLKKARQAGAVTKNGYDMLIIQAEESWRIWNS